MENKKTLPEYTLEDIEKLTQKNSICIISIFGKFYNLSASSPKHPGGFLAEHPGGAKALMHYTGDIADDVFEDGNHQHLKDEVCNLLKDFEYGVLKK